MKRSLAAGFASLLLAGTALAQAPIPAPAPAPQPPVAAQEPSTIRERVGDAVRAVSGEPAADRDMLRVLSVLSDLDPKQLESLQPAEARQQPSAADAVQELLRRNNQPPAPSLGVAARDITIPGPGGPLAARVYTPDGPVAGGAGQQRPLIVYFHGGGFVIADLNTYDSSPRALSHLTGAVAVAVHYRQGPENKFPAAHDDAVAAYRWVVDNARSLGGDPARVAVVGESAGGNLAANVAVAARDGNLRAPVAQVLIYPVAGVDMNTDSYLNNEKAKPLNKAMMAWFMEHYLRNDSDRGDPRIDLVGRATLNRLPPATVITAGIDPLMTEGQRLADRLREAGVPVASRNYPGVTHEFFGMGAVVAAAADAQAFAAARLSAAFGNAARDLPPGGPARLVAVAARIESRMEVLGSDGAAVGTVNNLDGGNIRLTRDGTGVDNRHHLLPLERVSGIEGQQVTLNLPAEQARQEWQSE